MSTAFTEIAEALAAAGGIDRIGVAEEAGEMALAYAGVNILRKYGGGVKKAELLFTLSGADTSDRQQQLIEGMTDALNTLNGRVLDVETDAEYGTLPCAKVTYPPRSVMFNGNYWIYNAGLKVLCYIKI